MAWSDEEIDAAYDYYNTQQPEDSGGSFLSRSADYLSNLSFGDVGEAAKAALIETPSGLAKGAGGLSRALAEQLPQDWRWTQDLLRGSEIIKERARNYDQMAMSDVPENARGLAEFGAGVTQMIPALMSGPFALPMFGMDAFGRTYEDARDAGRGTRDSLKAGATQGALTAALMKIPLKAISRGEGLLGKTLSGASAGALLTPMMEGQNAIRETMVNDTEGPTLGEFLQSINPLSADGAEKYATNAATMAMLGPIHSAINKAGGVYDAARGRGRSSEKGPSQALESLDDLIQQGPPPVDSTGATPGFAPFAKGGWGAEIGQDFLLPRDARNKYQKPLPPTPGDIPVGPGESGFARVQGAKINERNIPDGYGRPIQGMPADVMEMGQRPGYQDPLAIETNRVDPALLDGPPAREALPPGVERALLEAPKGRVPDEQVINQERVIFGESPELAQSRVSFVNDKFNKQYDGERAALAQLEAQRAQPATLQDRIAQIFGRPMEGGGLLEPINLGTVGGAIPMGQRPGYADPLAIESNLQGQLAIGGPAPSQQAALPDPQTKLLDAPAGRVTEDKVIPMGQTIYGGPPTQEPRAQKVFNGPIAEPGKLTAATVEESKATEAKRGRIPKSKTPSAVSPEMRAVEESKKKSENSSSSVGSKPRLAKAPNPEAGVLRVGEIADTILDGTKSLFENIGLGGKEIKKLPPGERFMSGRMGLQVLPREAIAVGRNILTYPKTLADKFPEFKPLYETGQKRIRMEQRSASEINDYLKPYWKIAGNEQLRKPVDHLLQKHREQARQIRVAGGDPPHQMFADEVAQRLTPEQQEAYKGVRLAMQKGADKIAEALAVDAYKIKDPAAKQEYIDDVNEYVDALRSGYYVPFSRYGKGFEVASVDAQGNTLYKSFFDSRSAALKAAKKQRSLGDQRKVTVAERAQITQDAFDQFPAALVGEKGAFDAEKYTKQAKDRVPGGFTRHLIRAALTPGYEQNLVRSIADYSLALSRWHARRMTLPEFDTALSSIDPQEQPQLRAKAIQFKDSLDKSLPLAAALGNASNFMNLAGTASSGIQNLTQTLTTTLPEILKYEKNPARVASLMSKSWKVGWEYVSDKLTGSARFIDPELRAGLDRALADGVVEAQAMNDLRRMRKGAQLAGAGSKAFDGLMKFFTVPEAVNRATAFAAGWEIAKSKGLPKEQWTKFAEDFVDETQFVTNRGNQPLVAQNVIGKVLLQYKTSYLGNMLRYLRKNATWQTRSTFATSIGVSYLMAGYAAIPFAKEVVEILKRFGVDAVGAARDMMSKPWSDFVLKGIQPFGVNLTSSAGIEVVPVSGDLSKTEGLFASLFGPSYSSFVDKPLKALDLYNQGKTRLAVEQIVPRFARGPLLAERAAREGKLLDARGNNLLDNPTNTELIQMALGFNPSRKADSQMAIRRLYEMLTRSQKQGEDLKDQFVTALRNKDINEARKIMAEAILRNSQADLPSEKIKMTSRSVAERLKSQERGILNEIPRDLVPEAMKILREETSRR